MHSHLICLTLSILGNLFTHRLRRCQAPTPRLHELFPAASPASRCAIRLTLCPAAIDTHQVLHARHGHAIAPFPGLIRNSSMTDSTPRARVACVSRRCARPASRCERGAPNHALRIATRRGDARVTPQAARARAWALSRLRVREGRGDVI
jgi:hypothetical protein